MMKQIEKIIHSDPLHRKSCKDNIHSDWWSTFLTIQKSKSTL